jgi:hypothetical protein
VSGAIVAQIEHDGVTRQKSPHDFGRQPLPRSQKDVDMVVEKGPGVAVGFGFQQKGAETGEEIFPVLIIKEDGAPLDPSDDDVLKQAGDIYAGMSWHRVRILEKLKM